MAKNCIKALLEIKRRYVFINWLCRYTIIIISIIVTIIITNEQLWHSLLIEAVDSAGTLVTNLIHPKLLHSCRKLPHYRWANLPCLGECTKLKDLFVIIVKQVFRTLTMCIYPTTLMYLCSHLSLTWHTFTPPSQVPGEYLLLLESQYHLVNLISTVFSRS